MTMTIGVIFISYPNLLKNFTYTYTIKGKSALFESFLVIIYYFCELTGLKAPENAPVNNDDQ